MKKIICILMLCAAVNIALAQTPRINFKAPRFYPEGIATVPGKAAFYTGSVTTGSILLVNSDGTSRVFYSDSSLRSSFGMKAEPKTNILWINTGDPNYSLYSTPETHKKLIRLIGLDLVTGEKKHDLDLTTLQPGEHFANDLALDDAGNKYITDSDAPIIYKVDNRNIPSVFAKNDLFQGADIGLNGIEWFAEGFLLVVNSSTGSILKIDTETGTVSKVKIDTFFPGADGLLKTGRNEIALVVNKGVNKIYRVSSTDGWSTAKIIGASSAEDRFQHPSTIAMLGNKLYAVNSKLNELTDKSLKPSDEFSFQLVTFK